ncbi:hypothetical protein [Micromonospora sp. DT233]|uniref:hypothetical protein n=1 Tax=Micromonospora sp. DT233 TaxID=3393432 RepID=UPI003CEB7205
MARVTPQQLALKRVISIDSLSRNEVDLRGYPHRHLALASATGLTRSAVTELMEGVEYLAQFGWELVSITAHASVFYAFLRRR